MRKLLGNGARLDRSGSDPVMPYMQSPSRDWTRLGGYQVRQKSKERLFLTPSPTSDDEYGDFTHPKIINGHWQGFDGPSEEIVVQRYHNQSQRSPEAKRAQRKISPPPVNGSQEIRAILDEDEDDPHSHAAMSRRAELILANAKKRLLVSVRPVPPRLPLEYPLTFFETMESNLSRARHGLNGRPSSSMSSFASHIPASASLDTVLERTDPTSPSDPIPRHSNSVLASGNSKGHTRVFSETSVPSFAHSQAGLEDLGGNHLEGSSALNPASGNSNQVQPGRAQSADASRGWFWTGLNRDGSTPGRPHKPLEPLHEDKPAQASFSSSPFTSSSPSTVNQELHVSERPLSEAASANLGNSPPVTLTRARSTAQMRDLRDQMQDLKGKISNLKQKAREDSLRRRSLQSLRTPSPFTAAEQWYTGTSDPVSTHQNQVTEAPDIKDSTQIAELDAKTKAPPEPGHSGISRSSEPDQQHGIIPGHDEDSINGARKEFDIVPDPYRSSSDSPSVCGRAAHEGLELAETNFHGTEELEMINAYDEGFDPEDCHRNDDHEAEEGIIGQDAPEGQIRHDTFHAPLGDRHEDRPDAFDYEHFFLHSGMCHSSTADLSRTSSHSSMYSEETTKPTNSVTEEPSENDECNYGLGPNETPADSNTRPNIHLRQNSAGSISTVATFATATEGRGPDDEKDEDGWISRRPMAGNWPLESPAKRVLDQNRRDAPRFPGSKHARGVGVATSIKQPRSTTYPVRSSSLSTPIQPCSSASPPSSSSWGLLSALSASTPTQEGVSATTLQLRDGDKDLVERLIRSLFNVCVHLHTGSAEGERYENKIWRRRLDAARRVLDGDIHGEAF